MEKEKETPEEAQETPQKETAAKKETKAGSKTAKTSKSAKSTKTGTRRRKRVIAPLEETPEEVEATRQVIASILGNGNEPEPPKTNQTGKPSASKEIISSESESPTPEKEKEPQESSRTTERRERTMSESKKKKSARQAKTYRLSDRTINQLEEVQAHISDILGTEFTATQAIEYVINDFYRGFKSDK